MTLLLSETLFSNILNGILGFFDDKNYSSYFASGSTNSLRSVFVSLVPLTFIFLNAHKLNGNSVVYAKLTIVSFLLSILALQSTVLIRIRMYFEIFSIITVPQIFFESQKSSNSVSNVGSKFYLMINKYAFPILTVLIYLLKYLSFFHDPVWQSFLQYKTILWR